MFRRINLFAGPGAGKSTAAAMIFAWLKAEGYSIELVDEYVKSWAFENRKINKFDQVYLFAKQLRKENLVLLNSHGMIITDSPLILSVYYGRIRGFHKWEALEEIALDFEKQLPSINIFLNRDNCKYSAEGRFEDYDEAIEIDNGIKEYLNSINFEYYEFRYDDYRSMINSIKEKSGQCRN